MTRLNEVLSQAQYKQIGGNQHGSNIRSWATNFSVHMCVGILVLGRESKWKVKPKTRCNHRTCRTLIDYDKRYCSSHDGVVHKRYDASRDVEVKRIYSSGRWTEREKQPKRRDDYL